MTHLAAARAALWLAGLWLLCGVAPAAADLYLTPSLDTAVGVTSNRFRTADDEASMQVTATPALQLTAYPEGGGELQLGIAHTVTRYLEPGFGTTQDTWLGATARGPLGRVDLAGSASAGAYRDSEIPSDDNRWLGLELSAGFDAAATWGAGLAAAWRHTRYDDPFPGQSEYDDWARLAPFLAWSPSPESQLTLEPRCEALWADQSVDDYAGYGLLLAAQGYASETVQAGAWADWSRLRYEGGDRENGTAAGAWTRYRWRPWLELVAEGSWSRWDPAFGAAYTIWTAQLGLSLSHDFTP